MMLKRRLFFFLAAILTALVGCNDRPSSGDRVLVAKFPYEAHVSNPQRFDVVVFKYPNEPVNKLTHVPTNYIKRLLGLPGELIAIFFGRLFHIPAPPAGSVPYYDDLAQVDADPNSLWQKTHDSDNIKQFDAGDFQILRKPPAVMLAMRRIVYDNDFPAKDLTGPAWERWLPAEGSGWKADTGRGFNFQVAAKDQVDWLRYRHILRPQEGGPEKPMIGLNKPQLITDFMAYNSFKTQTGADTTPSPNWVGDLMLECNLQVTKAEGEFWMELSKGINRFQARWDLSTGMCTLFKLGSDGQKEELDSKATRMKASGNYALRFSNIDARLTVWVDGDLPFENGREYSPPEVRGPGDEKLTEEALRERRGPTKNDLEPASVGSKGGAVAVRGLKLWRDTYYTQSANIASDITPPGFFWDHDLKRRAAFTEILTDPTQWDFFKKMPYKTMYVQPGHFLCLGDNSQQSSDSRAWGLVPERLMLGRALLVYFPFDRAGAIR
jgi:signal peptidase I